MLVSVPVNHLLWRKLWSYILFLLWQITKWVCWQIEDLMHHCSFLRRWVLTNSFPKEQIPSFTITIIGLQAFLACHYLLTNMLMGRWVSTKHIWSSRGKHLRSQIKYRGMKSEPSSNTHTHTHAQKHKTFNTAKCFWLGRNLFNFTMFLV